MAKTAILLGGSGLVGNYLLDLLLEDENYEKIKIFSRRPLNKNHRKIQEFICDLSDLFEYKDDFKADEVYCALGTTKRKTPNKDEFRAIDFGLVKIAAKLSSENNIKTFCVISVIGADKNSPFFYTKTKGQMEEAVNSCNIKNTIILRPSFIYGPRKEFRIGEEIGILIAKTLAKIMPNKFKKYQPIHAKDLAKQMYEKSQI